MKKVILAGSADQTIDLFAQDSTATDGSGLTGLAYDTASLTCYYRKGATGSAVALSLATQTVGGAHSDGGFVEIDATNMPGVYRLDLSDTIVDTEGSVTLYLHGAADMAPVTIELQVGSATRGLAGTALPSVAADGAGGLPTTTKVTDARLGALTDWIDGGRLDLLIDALATATELAKVPKSDSNVTWNATALASINAEVDTALNTAIPGGPTADSINERIATMDATVAKIETMIEEV